MRMKVQGRFIQARFFEIHHFFAEEKRSDTFLTDLVERIGSNLPADLWNVTLKAENIEEIPVIK